MLLQLAFLSSLFLTLNVDGMWMLFSTRRRGQGPWWLMKVAVYGCGGRKKKLEEEGWRKL